MQKIILEMKLKISNGNHSIYGFSFGGKNIGIGNNCGGNQVELGRDISEPGHFAGGVLGRSGSWLW